MSTDLLNEQFMTTEQVAALLGMSVQGFQCARARNPEQTPPYIRINARVLRYSPRDVAAWLAARRVDPANGRVVVGDAPAVVNVARTGVPEVC